MKIIIPLLAVMLLAGCENNSTDQSSATNSVSGEPSAGSGLTNNSSTNMVDNAPSVEMTNAPEITNGIDTNVPAMTNQ
jgi:uncharacterized lipoprotein YajG